MPIGWYRRKLQYFYDVRSIALGVDFRDISDREVERCEAMLVIIDYRWLDARGGAGDTTPVDYYSPPRQQPVRLR